MATSGLVIPEPKIASTDPSRLYWYALYTCSRHEKQVARHLEHRQVEHYLPLYSSVRRWKDRRVHLDMPLFPGYVFVRIAFEERMRVLTVPSAVALVTANGRGIPLPEEELERVRAGLTGGVTVEPHPYLKIGRRVRVRCGPFAGAEGVLVKKKNALRVVIAFELIHQAIALEVDAADVEHT